MEIRELLHKEIWTKKVSRIIAIAALLFCCIALLWADWVTPRERRLIQETINKADDVAGPEILSSSEFEKQNTVLLQLADKAASMQITERDKIAALLLRGYVTELSYHR